MGVGEVLWDLLPSGPQLGGAPANFAYHARQLGADAHVITRIGNDDYGKRVLQRFAEMDIATAMVQLDEKLPTGTATVALNGDGIPKFTINEGVAWDALAETDEALASVRIADAVCFGTLAQRTIAGGLVIQRLVAATPTASLRVFDVNLRQGFANWPMLERSLHVADVLKLNEDELSTLSPRLGLSGSANQILRQLAGRFNLELIAFTRGERGSLLYRHGNWSELPGRKIDILDTIGAGDAFTAALVLGLLNQLSLDDIHRVAADVAGYVCSQQGATPVLPANLRAAFVPNCTSV